MREPLHKVSGFKRLLCRYSIGKILGAGSFGVVREAVHKATHRRCALVCIISHGSRGQRAAC